MWTRAKSVLGTIVLALAAEPFVWLLNDWRDAHKDSLPAWRETAGAMLDLIPPYVLWTFAAGATFAFVVLRGWRRPSVAPSASGGEEKGPRSGTAAPALSPRITFEPKPDWVVQRTGEDGGQWKTIRLKLVTPQPLREALPYLAAVRKWERGGWSETANASNKLRLSWPGHGNRYDSRRIINEEWIILFNYQISTGRLSMETKDRMHSIRSFLDDTKEGRYLLTIKVESEQGVVEGTFEFSWFGDIENFSLENVSGRLAT